jgi:hypothetical protein
MDCGIGMFLAGLVSGTGMGWYAYSLHIRAAYGDPKDLKRALMLYKGLLHKGWLICRRERAGRSSIKLSGAPAEKRGTTAQQLLRAVCC